MSIWLPLTVERALYVDRGRDVILCDRHLEGELLVKVSDAALAAFLREATPTPTQGDRG